MLKDEIGESLGEEMYEAHRDGDELPEIELYLSEEWEELQRPDEAEKLEKLICAMTSFHPKDRPSAVVVQSELSTIITEVTTIT